jgi:hypothetical protein
MPSQEFEDILTSLQQIVRQAYSLGRSEALKQVVEVLKADAASAKPLALLGPADEPAPSIAPHAGEHVATPQVAPDPLKASNDDHGASGLGGEVTPWWARAPRTMW